MIITGSSIYKKSSNYTLGGPLPGGHYYNNSFSFILAITGLGAVVGSIPLFISAHNNKKRAASVAIGNQNIFLPQQNALKTQPTVSLRIAL